MKLKRMGVVNITPNSFSDPGEALTPSLFLAKVHSMGPMDALDIGAESTAPMNASISAEEEWERWESILHLIPELPYTISADTYHPETISKLVRFWKDQKLSMPLWWNDVSGKIDDSVRDFLKEGEDFHYVLCHNRAPNRELSGRHMDYVKEAGDILLELQEFFSEFHHPRVIYDPCLGFSKTYEENWKILESFSELQKMVPHDRWLLGFSRKSFLRKKLGITLDRERLDLYHEEVLDLAVKNTSGEIWIRTHRPDLVK